MLRTTKDLIASRVDDIAYEQLKLKNMRYNQRKATATIAFMERVLARFDGKFSSVNNWIDISGYSTDAVLRIHLELKVTSLTTGPLADLLRFLMEAELDAKPARDNTGSTYAYREFKFKKEATATMLPIDVVVYASVIEGDDATCRKVQIGVETKEVPVFAIKCD